MGRQHVGAVAASGRTIAAGGAIWWLARTGSPWRDVPERCVPWETVRSVFRRRQKTRSASSGLLRLVRLRGGGVRSSCLCGPAAGPPRRTGLRQRPRPRGRQVLAVPSGSGEASVVRAWR
ncbi:transposase [Streptomyces sp. NBC_00304]|uniref:transposase n=1 Tax=Streptomyces sp. NBC_00304 TaxID=2975706 RepID=UPI003FA7C048